MDNIDWTDPTSLVTPHFSVHNMLFLPQWNRLANESDGLDDDVKANLIDLANRMETVRESLGGNPIRVHCCLRPTLYNALPSVGGAADSSHIANTGCAAMDWDNGLNCDDVRQKILDLGLLDSLNMRMEDSPGSNWVHLDTRIPLQGHNRFFKP